ncbi:MAG: molybdopterin molybdenumtransferase MoeA, partial [Candidatus Riflebacteria bacterium]|nr:molybdopterin molybdenumtransferase MoeA [Candidatus Riflebacteria bacterium]
PASSLVVFLTVVAPCLDHLLGALPGGRSVLARLTRPVRSAPGREEYLKVRLGRDESGEVAEPLFGQSGNVWPLARAHGLVRVPVGSEGLAAGELVEVMVMP